MQSTHAANPEEWSKLAKQYNTFALQLTRLHSAEALRLLNLGKEDHVVLDVAAGTGAFALQAAQELQRVHASDKDYKVLATDFAEAMVAACRTEAHDQGLSDIVECKQMDGQVTSIPSFVHRVMFTNLISLLFQDMSSLRDDSVDAIGCVFGVMFFPDVVKSFREMLRVLRPGGRAVIVVWKKVATLRLMQEFTQRLRAALPQASATEAADEAQSEATARMVYRLGDPDELTKQLNAAGFTNDQIVSMSPFEAEWTGIEPTDEVVGMMLDKPGVKASYAPEQRDRAAAIVKEWFQTATWDNISLIALLKK